jgi:hypothetical protein
MTRIKNFHKLGQILIKGQGKFLLTLNFGEDIFIGAEIT